MKQGKGLHLSIPRTLKEQTILTMQEEWALVWTQGSTACAKRKCSIPCLDDATCRPDLHRGRKVGNAFGMQVDGKCSPVSPPAEPHGSDGFPRGNRFWREMLLAIHTGIKLKPPKRANKEVCFWPQRIAMRLILSKEWHWINLPFRVPSGVSQEPLCNCYGIVWHLILLHTLHEKDCLMSKLIECRFNI